MNDKLIVLHSCDVWLPQTQTWMHGQVSELQRLGVNTHVACERRVNLSQFVVKNIHCFADETLIEQIWDKALRRLRIRHHLPYSVNIGRKSGATVVHSHFGNIGWANLAAVRKLGAKHVVTFYGYDVNKLPVQSAKWLQRYQQLFAEADLFLCEGSHMANCLVQLGCPTSKVRVHHLGVDVERIIYKPRPWQSGEPLKVLIAARFTEKKGIPYAIEALGLLGCEVPIELTLIGDAGKNAENMLQKKQIFDSLNSSGLIGNTHWMGFQTHEVMMQEAYNNHLYLQPSVLATDGDTEGGAPVSIIEMLASGMPVIATTHCDIPEVMGKELRDLLAPERDAPAVADRIRMLLAQPARWLLLAQAWRTRAETQYSRAIQGERLRDIYAAL